MRVYCGLASAGERLTAAVVDGGGQVAAVQQVPDGPEGYSELLNLLAARVDPPGVLCVPFSSDSSDHRISQLLAASGRPLCFVDHATVLRLAAAEPQDAADDARRAVAMARGLYAGTLTASAHPPPPQLAGLLPVLASHAAITFSRNAAVAALREVLRQLYPAALRAFPDPGAGTPLALLDALPDPQQVTRGQEESVLARLGTAGFKDAADALGALRQAVAEQPPTDTVPESTGITVRQTVAAVVACDTAASTLVREVAEWLARCEGVTPAQAPTSGPPPGSWAAGPGADAPASGG
ncbi:MAG: transposase, partial [Actinocatenispora sp.]